MFSAGRVIGRPAVRCIVFEVETMHGQIEVLTTDCPYDHESYKELPKVVLVDGSLYCRTGFNSERKKAYYKPQHELRKQGVVLGFESK